MLYLIGLGLDEKGISLEGMDILKRCKKIYLENYTADFPYSTGVLKEIFDRKIIDADREFIESFEIIEEARKIDIALLVYGSPLTATTHISLLDEAKKSDVKYRIIYSASVIDSVAETGLQLYKFGKTTSMPKWQEDRNFTPDSFMEVVKENQSIDAHTLILIDIGLEFHDALTQLKEASKKHNFKLNRIVLCQTLGTRNRKIFYKKVKDFEEFDSVRKPFCMIIPGKLHFLEEEFLNGL
ncbi:MAG: diphthine synthase [Nanoarchaeota archaeon]